MKRRDGNVEEKKWMMKYEKERTERESDEDRTRDHQ